MLMSGTIDSATSLANDAHTILASTARPFLHLVCQRPQTHQSASVKYYGPRLGASE